MTEIAEYDEIDIIDRIEALGGDINEFLEFNPNPTRDQLENLEDELLFKKQSEVKS